MERVLIVEDEQLAASKLKMLLKMINPDIEVLDMLSSVSESVRWLSLNTVDLIFMDINLSDDISFKIFDQVNVDAPIIFTTAYDEYAIKAFKQNSLDYILKPVTEEELRGSLAKYQKYKLRSDDYGDKIKTLLSQYLPDKNYKSRILVTYGGKSKSVEVNDIAYLYAYEKGVYLTLFDNTTFLTDETLDTLEKAMNPKTFYRVNRKFLVSFKSIAEVSRFSTRRLKLDLVPPPKFDALVPAEKITAFKDWLGQ
ncbi:MAG: LytTR family DNA-binding domain-containing protein [Bacteroidota bacterium]